jgi:antitoxin VapB
MALNIKDAETDRLVRRLALVTGERITDAVRTAVKERLEREERSRHAKARVAAALTIAREYMAKPLIDPAFVEESLYDSDGLPR